MIITDSPRPGALRRTDDVIGRTLDVTGDLAAAIRQLARERYASGHDTYRRKMLRLFTATAGRRRSRNSASAAARSGGRGLR